MKKPHVVYATRFPGELPAINRFLDHLYRLTAEPVGNFLPRMPEFKIRGTRLGPNAWTMTHTVVEEIIHAEDLRNESFLVIGEVTAFFVPALHNEPGMHLKWWRDHAERTVPLREMSDRESLAYLLERMKHLQGPDRSAVFKTALSTAIVIPADETTTNGRASLAHPTEGSLKGKIRETPEDLHIDGVPFAPVFATEYGWLLGELCAMEMEFRDKHNLFDHRERALLDLLSDQGVRRFVGLDPNEA